MDGTLVSVDDDLDRRVVAILAAQALRDPCDLRPETSLESLGIDSLGLAEVIFAIEETFDVSVPFNANAPTDGGLDLGSVGAVCAAVRRLVHGARG